MSYTNRYTFDRPVSWVGRGKVQFGGGHKALDRAGFANLTVEEDGDSVVVRWSSKRPAARRLTVEWQPMAGTTWRPSDGGPIGPVEIEVDTDLDKDPVVLEQGAPAVDWREEYNKVAHWGQPSRYDDIRPEDFGSDDDCFGWELHASAPAWVAEALVWMGDDPSLRQNVVDHARRHWPDGKSPYPRAWRSRYTDGTETPRSAAARQEREAILREARERIAEERSIKGD